MKYKAVIFDLDGTVLDTIRDLASAANYALAQHGYPTHSVDGIRRRVGNGVANLIRRAAPEGTSEEELAQILSEFKAYYRDHIDDTTKPYEGIPELMRDLRAAGIYVGINSNKFDAALQALCRIHFPNLYDYAVGESEQTPRKPDPTAAERIIAAANAGKGDAIYIGDSSVDIETAKNAGVDAGWVSWGFRTRDEMAHIDIPHTFDRVDDLRTFLLGE